MIALNARSGSGQDLEMPNPEPDTFGAWLDEGRAFAASLPPK
ncbi:hypothetical protein [Streptomyces sp. DG1A-41]